MLLIGIVTLTVFPGRMLRFLGGVTVAIVVPTTPEVVDAVTVIGVTPLDGTLPLLVIARITDPLAGESLTSAAGSVVVSVSVSVTNGGATSTVELLAAEAILLDESTVSTIR